MLQNMIAMEYFEMPIIIITIAWNAILQWEIYFKLQKNYFGYGYHECMIQLVDAVS